jgi:tetratricopeptide (TPR) repeat protein
MGIPGHAVIVALASVTLSSLSYAALADDRETCKTASGDSAIEACTKAIDSKKYLKQRRTLSLLYTNRGVEYEKKQDYARAIADHDLAIKTDPKNPLAFNNRGNAYAAKGDYEHAITDYDQAVKLNPKYAEAFYNRGLAKRKKSDWTGGDADIAQAKELQPNIGGSAN